MKYLVQKQKYWYRTSDGKRFKCRTLEEVWKVAYNEGVSPADLDYDPQIVPQGNGKCNIHVTYFRKPNSMGLILPGGM